MEHWKSVLKLVLITFMLWSPVRGASQEEFTKTKIAILDFRLQGEGLDQDMGEIVAEWIITALVKDGRFEVVERRLLESVIEEHKLVMSGVVDAGSAEELGHLLGVKVIITGSLMSYQNVMEANARIIDVRDASIIAAESVQSTDAVTLEELVKKMTEKIIRDFPLDGYIVSCNGDTVMLDLGMNSGVKPGMQFSVYKEGQIIKHPKTGEVLDIERLQSAIVEIETVREKLSTAKIISRTEGMTVEYGQHVSSIQLPRSLAKMEPAPEPEAVKTVPMPNAPVQVEAPPRVQAMEPLPAAPVVSPTVPMNYTPDNPLHRRIQSKDSKTKTSAIREVAKMKYIDQSTLALLESELLRGYTTEANDKSLIDGLSWCCTILGRTGDSKYEKTLITVSMGTHHKKLRGYAQNGLELLEKSRR